MAPQDARNDWADRPPARRRAALRQRRWRQRKARRQAVYAVTIDGEVLNMLVRLGHLADHEASDRKQVARAIAALLTEAARH
jgi:hypothetical protein